MGLREKKGESIRFGHGAMIPLTPAHISDVRKLTLLIARSNRAREKYGKVENVENKWDCGRKKANQFIFAMCLATHRKEGAMHPLSRARQDDLGGSRR